MCIFWFLCMNFFLQASSFQFAIKLFHCQNFKLMNQLLELKQTLFDRLIEKNSFSNDLRCCPKMNAFFYSLAVVVCVFFFIHVHLFDQIQTILFTIFFFFFTKGSTKRCASVKVSIYSDTSCKWRKLFPILCLCSHDTTLSLHAQIIIEQR